VEHGCKREESICKHEESICKRVPSISPCLVTGPQRVLFIELLAASTGHRVVKQSVAIAESVVTHAEEGIEMGPGSFVGGLEGYREWRHAPVGEPVDLAG
jgi:hypothetical protein